MVRFLYLFFFFRKHVTYIHPLLCLCKQESVFPAIIIHTERRI